MEPEKEKDGKAKGKNRLIRILIVTLAAFLVVRVVKSLASQPKNKETIVSSIGHSLKGKAEAIGDKVLGMAVKYLPGAPDLEEIGVDKEEVEPIKRPTEDIKKQTEELLEMIKKLPQDQIEAIKKQIYKDFCQGLLGGDNEKPEE